MRIYITSVFVDDQAEALEFYTKTLGFKKKTDIPLGEYRWLTVVPAEEPSGVELLLEPSEHPAVNPFKKALVEDGIPFASFEVDDLQAECRRLQNLGVRFVQELTEAEDHSMAVIDDTCGNLVSLIERKP